MISRVYVCAPERDDGVAVPEIVAVSLDAACEIVRILMRPDVTRFVAVRVYTRAPLPIEEQGYVRATS